ncbi:MAG: hypothetical protein K6L81_11075 [Agarilytica sp.]
MDTSLIFLIVAILSGLGIYLHGRAMKNDEVLKRYSDIDGETVRFSTAVFGSNHYLWVIEYKLGDKYFGLKCGLPKFAFVCKYEDINLEVKKNLIGHWITVKVPDYPEGFHLYPRIAKKLEALSGGKFGYSQSKV